MDKKTKRLFYLEYTLLFTLIAGLIVFYYYSQGRSMIDASGDGFRQHFRALVYYSKLLRKTLSSFAKGSFSVPQWDLSIGEGSDILSAFHYYCAGDVFALVSVFFPESMMHICYDGITVLRMYCSGLAFSSLCFYKQKGNLSSILTGSLLYAFSSFAVISMRGHVFFISAAVFLPLIILGVEKIICHDRPFLLPLAVVLSALSNVYFFYMNVITTVLYVAVRLVFIKDTYKERLLILIRIALYSLLGVLMSCVVFLPVFMMMIGSGRLESSFAFGLLFSAAEYLDYFKKLTFKGSYFGGFSIFWPLAFAALFARKKDPNLIALLILSLLFVGIPYLSSVYNAFTYPTNRWCYAVSLLVSYIYADVLADTEESRNILPVSLIMSILYYGVCMYLETEEWKLHLLLMLMTVFYLLFIKLVKNRKLCNVTLVLMTVAFLLFQDFYMFSPNYWNYAKNGVEISGLQQRLTGENIAFEMIDDDSFFRYSGSRMTENVTVQSEYSSPQYYWSIANNYVADFRGQLGYSDASLHHFRNYGERFAQNMLSGVKYYINGETDYVPYGYESMGSAGDYNVYSTGYALPLAYAYDSYIPMDVWNSLDAVQKNEALAQGAVIGKDIKNIEKTSLAFEASDVPYELSTDDKVSLVSGSITTHGEGAKIYIDVNSEESGEYYVVIEGLETDRETANMGIAYGDILKYILYKGTANRYYTDRHTYITNLGYYEGLSGRITVDLLDTKDCVFDSIRIVCQPLERQIKYLERLRDHEVSNPDIGVNTISVTADTDRNKLLCFAVPYSEGWKAYIDGERAELLNCNIQYMAVMIPSGQHEIVLRYETPLLKEGAMISLAGAIVYVYLLMKDIRKKDLVKEND